MPRLFTRLVLTAALLVTFGTRTQAADALPGGELRVLDAKGAPSGICPLERTAVQAHIGGYVGHVRVQQRFTNRGTDKIEAVYVFPLPHNAAVDSMTMTVGGRRIEGQIKPRAEAKVIYDQARAAGHVAALLNQERPNIFTQAVANIEPGAGVDIEISYSETVAYKDGAFEWAFPTVVGPRYMPGAPTGKSGTGWSPDTTKVPDASKISPPVALPGTRAGHDITLTVTLDSGNLDPGDANGGGGDDGYELSGIESASHKISVDYTSGGAKVTLANEKELPNKDFVLRYRTATDKIGDAFLTHTDRRGTFFTLVLQPPRRVERAQAVPRELVFVLDTSGSMGGFPIEKAKAVMSRAIDELGPRDAFNLITFAGDTHILWDRARPSTAINRAEAQQFLASRNGGGGTEMMKAINAALEGQDPERVRIVCFMTDGYVGNDFAIVDAVKRNAKTARVFAFGIGNSVNRFLLENMARAGRGEVDFVQLQSKADEAAERFYQRINTPVLTDIAIDWGKLPVSEVYPKAQPDLFSNQPLMIHGRLKGPAEGTITLRGTTGAGAFERAIEVTVPRPLRQQEALAALWARQKIDSLMRQDMAALQNNTFPKELQDEITALGVDYRLMTQFTSFVAVETQRITKDGKTVTVAVPVEMPDGVSYEGVFGNGPGLNISVLSAVLGRSRGGPLLARAARTEQAAATVESKIPAPPRATTSKGAEWASPNATARTQIVPTAPALTPSRPSANVANSAVILGSVAALAGFSGSSDATGAPFTPIAIDEAKIPIARAKLSEVLRAIADRVKADGKTDTFTVEGLKVAGYRVNIVVTLRDTKFATLETLTRLGFVTQPKSATESTIAGSIDVRRLLNLAAHDMVIGVAPEAVAATPRPAKRLNSR